MQMAIAAIPAVLGAVGQQQSGEIARIESKVQAKQVETAAAAREADRKADLARAAASQSAAAGAGGIAFEGSPLTVLQEDIRREEEATERDMLSSQLSADATRFKGSVAKSRAEGLAAGSLIKFAADEARTGRAPSGGSK